MYICIFKYVCIYVWFFIYVHLYPHDIPIETREKPTQSATMPRCHDATTFPPRWPQWRDNRSQGEDHQKDRHRITRLVKHDEAEDDGDYLLSLLFWLLSLLFFYHYDDDGGDDDDDDDDGVC